jgi:hypothetical protein
MGIFVVREDDCIVAAYDEVAMMNNDRRRKGELDDQDEPEMWRAGVGSMPLILEGQPMPVSAELEKD